MKKFRLTKEYPGSPKLNEIIEFKSINNFQCTRCSFGKLIYEQTCKNYPEFWEEVVEKDYEILSYKSFKERDILLCNEKYDKNFFNNNNWLIYSVKRLSDGEVFTIGDKTCEDDIVGFIISQNKIGIQTKRVGLFDLNKIQKVKQPLFTTEDGVDIYEGGKVYSIFKEYSSNTIFTKYLHDEHFGEDCELTYKNYYNFSTKEKAEEYILMNKPCLSFNDIESLNNLKEQYKYLNRLSITRSKLKELVKSKL